MKNCVGGFSLHPLSFLLFAILWAHNTQCYLWGKGERIRRPNPDATAFGSHQCLNLSNSVSGVTEVPAGFGSSGVDFSKLGRRRCLEKEVASPVYGPLHP